MSEANIYLTARLPAKLSHILKAHVSRDTHMNESEFVRDAIREKLQREAGDLYESIVHESGSRPSARKPGAGLVAAPQALGSTTLARKPFRRSTQ